MIKKLIPLVLALIVFYGCKMNYSFTGASIPPGTETVSIETFPNMAPIVNPMLSITLTEALKDKFMSQTSLQLINNDADLQFSGTIVGYRNTPTAIKAGEQSQAAMNRLTITVKVKYTNTMDPKADFDTKFSRYADYESSQDLHDVENTLADEIIDQIIDDIFNQSVVNW